MNSGMNEYTGLSFVYEELMDNVPYDDWYEYLVKTLRAYGIEDGIVLDLGCGTGAMTRRLASHYDMIGIDNAMDMLQIAMEQEDEGSQILYLMQDMREFELYGTVRAVVSVCDCLNYVTEPDDLLQVFQLVNNYLDPGGIFIFDVNTPYKYKEVIGDRTIAEERDDCAFIWQNTYYEEDKINEYAVTMFVEEEDGLYRRYSEIHEQRSYSIEELQTLIMSSGMELLAI
mgnify:CR=1 FL=1